MELSAIASTAGELRRSPEPWSAYLTTAGLWASRPKTLWIRRGQLPGCVDNRKPPGDVAAPPCLSTIRRGCDGENSVVVRGRANRRPKKPRGLIGGTPRGASFALSHPRGTPPAGESKVPEIGFFPRGARVTGREPCRLVSQPSSPQLVEQLVDLGQVGGTKSK